MIDEICEKYEIENYSINPDGSIDVDGDVNLQERKLTELPLKFNRVTGSFYCIGNELTTLEGCPKEVGEDFSCSFNELTTLVGSPNQVGGNFSCNKNKITSLVGSPNQVGWCFHCRENKLTSLVGCPKEVGANFNCGDNNLTDLTGLNKFNGFFICGDNPIRSIFSRVEQDFTYAFQVYQVINGKEINLKRLKYVMSTWNLPIDLEKIKEHYTLV